MKSKKVKIFNVPFMDGYKIVFEKDNGLYIKVPTSAGTSIMTNGTLGHNKVLASRARAKYIQEYDRLAKKRNEGIYKSEIEELDNLSNFILEKYK